MRIFHLADLHLGKIINKFSMIDEQEFVIEQIKNYIKQYKPDVLVLAGDIYDRTVPSFKAVALFDKFLNEVLIDLNTKIIAISGNHDGGELINFGSKIFEKANLYIEGRLSRNIRKISLRDEFGIVNFFLVPFEDYAVVRDIFEDNEIKSLNDAMKKIVSEIIKDLNENERNILVTHAYVLGGEISDSEKKLIIGLAECVDSSLFEKFDYVALGHLHKAQKVVSNKIRYSGSPLKYSFSEEKHNKSITMIDIDKTLKIELLKLSPKNDMRTVKGNLDDILNNFNENNKNDYLKVILTDSGEVFEPMAKLRNVYPNVMALEIERNLSKFDNDLLVDKSRIEKSPFEIFKEFYKFHVDDDLSERGQEIIKETINEVFVLKEDI